MKKVVEQLQKALDNQLAPIDLWMDASHHEGRSGSLASSSPLIPSTASSQWWEHDVYISYREKDGRMRFVSHLYRAFARKQIYHTEYDDRASWSETGGPSNLTSLKKSRIAIIVFSKGYAWSSSGLDELTTIMKLKVERGLTVMPLFYDVNPSEVRNQTGSYAQAFGMHERRNNINDKVESWRKALQDATDISGWDMSKGNEIESIQRLVDRISFELLRVMKPPETISHETSFDTYIIGREPRMKELKSLLEVGSRGVHMVGICGMWGSGKSTLASIVYDDISHKFEGCCFVKNVRAESRMHGLKMLQEKILSSVLKLEVTLKDIDHGINMMDTRLYKNNVLIVLDDVDHIDHLNMLAESKSWFGDGSRIIFTTRNQDLVNAHNAITHNVRMLDDTEAIELFSRHAFGKKEPIPGFEKVSLDMVSKFGGHPSALIRLGSFLRDKYKLNEWMYILARLEATPDAEILKKFKIRDDGVVRDISHWLLT